MIQDVSDYAKAQVDDRLEVLAAIELISHLEFGLVSKKVSLYLADPGEMILQVFCFYLFQVITTQDHMLNQLR